MDPNDNRDIVHLQYTCYMCRGMFVTARQLNQHLQQEYGLPITRYDRPEPQHIEMIPTDQYVFLNMMQPDYDNIPQRAVFVLLRHACSLCHSHYPTLEQLFRHVEVHFKTETQREHDDEVAALDQTFEFFASRPFPEHINFRPNAPAPNQQDNTNSIENENERPDVNEDVINEEGCNGKDKGSKYVEEELDNFQQNIEHRLPSVHNEENVDNGLSKEGINNNQQDLNPQDMDRAEDDGFTGSVIFNDGGRDIALNASTNADDTTLKDQSIFVDINLPETDQDSECAMAGSDFTSNSSSTKSKENEIL